jgi:hypothetical protein
MEKINNLFDQEITKTVDAYPSIFSKDDVVNLLSSLRTNVLNEISINTPTTGYDTDTILNVVRTMFSDYDDFDQYLDYEPELHGAYGGSYSLEINARFDAVQFARDFLCELPDYFEAIKEQ